MLDRSAIEALIPHAGAMCLLQSVEHWDAATIRCRASSHRDPANPLTAFGSLGAVCGVEYAAQAMALHGGLTGAVRERPRTGYLASLRSLVLYVERLDILEGDLVVEAEKLAVEGSGVVYGFRLTCQQLPILTGRAAVMLTAATS